MASLDQITRDITNSVDGALGCAVVDLNTGLLLSASHNVPYFTHSYLEAVAAAAVDMFRGKTVQAVESLLSNQRGKPVSNTIKEMQMTTENTLHFMITLPEKPNGLVVLITSKKTNLGMGWAQLRKSLPDIEPLVP